MSVGGSRIKLGLLAVAILALASGGVGCRGCRASGGRLVFVDHHPDRPMDLRVASVGARPKAFCAESGSRDEPFAVSADGKELAYVVRTPVTAVVHVASGAGCGDDRVAASFDGSAQALAWSPTGARLAFAAFTARPAPNPTSVHRQAAGGDWDVFVVDGTGAAKNVSDDFSDDTSPSWSPNGIEVAWVSSRDGHGDLYVLNANTRAIGRVTTNALLAPVGTSWSPDGRFVAAVRSAPSGMLADAELVRIAVDTGEVTTILRGDAAAKAARIEHAEMSLPLWSSDGTHVALSLAQTQSNANARYFQSRLLIVSLDGAARMVIDGQARCPMFSPDGTRVAFVASRSMADDVILVAPTGAGEPELAVEASGCPQWMP